MILLFFELKILFEIGNIYIGTILMCTYCK